SSGATTETGDPTPACAQSANIPFVTGRSNTIWYKIVPTGSGTANIDTIGSSYDSVLSVWSGTSQTALTAVACNDDINPGIVTVSQLTGVTLNAGTTYFIMVSSFGALDPNPVAFGGKSVLNFSFTGTIGGGTMPPGSGKGWWTLSAGTGLAAMLLLFLPGRKKYRVALGLGLVCVLSFALGCGGGSGNSGPVATTTTMTVNNTKLPASDLTGFRFAIAVAASVGANGQVQLFNGSAPLNGVGPVPVVNGSATIMSAGLTPGTYSISAHYLGDSKTLAVSSGTLNMTSTGTTTFVISATPAASNGNPTVSITIN